LELGDVKRVEALLVDDREAERVSLYKTVKIGSLVWMADNMDYKTNGTSWCGGGYGSSAGSCATYGRLYTWEAAQAVCPEGWKLPSKEDWETLFKAVGGTSAVGENNTSDYLEEVYAAVPSLLNNVGFNPVYAGSYNNDQGFRYKDEVGSYWTTGLFRAGLRWSKNQGVISTSSKDYAFSVRCIKK